VPIGVDRGAVQLNAKGLKRSTREGYQSILDRHLKPALGSLRIDSLSVAHVESYIAEKRRAKLEPRTIGRHLNLLSLVLGAAIRRGLLRQNPVALVDRPREPRRRWTILNPAEIARVELAFRELVSEAENAAERAWREQARTVFLLVIGCGLRRGEVLGLRWSDVDLADPNGALLRVRETWVRGAVDTPKSEAGERTIALDPVVAEELWQHRRRSRYQGDAERVFCHPEKGSPLDHKRYAATLKLALTEAKIERPMRPFHDGRHTSITNAAAAGIGAEALMARAGHSDYATTRRYIDLSGELFREEADRLGERVFGALSVAKPGSK
jgi:integrase